MIKISSPPIVDSHDAIHEWFELSYAQYLTIPRSVLQSMPSEWQARFVQCLNELDELIDWRPRDGRYWVELRGSNGRFAHDPLMDYERGRRRIPLTSPYLSFHEATKWLIETTRHAGVTAVAILPTQGHEDEFKSNITYLIRYLATANRDAIQSPDTHPFAWGRNGRSIQLPNGSEIAFFVPNGRHDLYSRLRGIELSHLLIHHTVQEMAEQSGIHAEDQRIFFDR